MGSLAKNVTFSPVSAAHIAWNISGDLLVFNSTLLMSRGERDAMNAFKLCNREVTVWTFLLMCQLLPQKACIELKRNTPLALNYRLPICAQMSWSDLGTVWSRALQTFVESFGHLMRLTSRHFALSNWVRPQWRPFMNFWRPTQRLRVLRPYPMFGLQFWQNFNPSSIPGPKTWPLSGVKMSCLISLQVWLMALRKESWMPNLLFSLKFWIVFAFEDRSLIFGRGLHVWSRQSMIPFLIDLWSLAPPTWQSDRRLLTMFQIFFKDKNNG